jgi:hypothetical protein
MFAAPIAVEVGASSLRDGFWFADVVLAGDALIANQLAASGSS